MSVWQILEGGAKEVEQKLNTLEQLYFIEPFSMNTVPGGRHGSNDVSVLVSLTLRTTSACQGKCKEK